MVGASVISVVLFTKHARAYTHTLNGLFLGTGSGWCGTIHTFSRRSHSETTGRSQETGCSPGVAFTKQDDDNGLIPTTFTHCANPSWPALGTSVISCLSNDDGPGALTQATSQPKPQPLAQQTFLPCNKHARSLGKQ